MANTLTLLARAALGSLCATLTVTAFAQSAEPTSAAASAARQINKAAAPARLSTETAARLAPSDTAAVLRVLPAGSELKPASVPDALPAPWQAVALDGPFTLYVRNGDIDKGLAIKPASPLYLEPDTAAAVVAYATEGDAITITGLRGRWTQIELQKPLTAYVSVSDTVSGSNTAAASATSTATTTRQVNQPATAHSLTASATKDAVIEAPADSSEPTATTVTKDAAAANESASAATTPEQIDRPATAATETEVLPEVLPALEAIEPEVLTVIDSEPAAQTPTRARSETTQVPVQPAYQPALNRSQIQGKLVSTRKRFGARRPYDWQLNAKSNSRVAYLDFSRLQGTDQLARYAGRQVVVYGLMTPLGDGQYVMQVESIRLQ